MSKHIKVSISASVMEKLLEGNPRAHSVAQGAMRVARLREELFKARIAEEAAIREYETDGLLKRRQSPMADGEDLSLSAPMAPEGSYVPSTGTRSPRRARNKVRVPTVPIAPPSPLRDPWKAPAGYEVSDVELPPYALHDPWKPMKPFIGTSHYDMEPELNRPSILPGRGGPCAMLDVDNQDACHMPLMKSFCIPPRLTLDRPCEVWMGVVLFNPTIGETILMKSCGVLETMPSVNWVFARSEREFDGCGA